MDVVNERALHNCWKLPSHQLDKASYSNPTDSLNSSSSKVALELSDNILAQPRLAKEKITEQAGHMC